MGSVLIGEVVVAALVAAALTGCLSLVGRAVAGRGRRPVLAPAVLDAAIVASLVAVLVATLSPLELLGTRLDTPSEVNLRPLEAMRGAPSVYAVINAVLLVPTVALLAQRWQRAGVLRLAAAGVLLSGAIELLQLVHPVRGTNVDDLLLNSGGAVVAAVLGVVVRRLRGRPGPPSGPTAQRPARDRSPVGAP